MHNKILVLDIETTGWLNQGGSIVEIGIVSLDLDNGKIEEKYHSLLREKRLTAKHRKEPFGWIFNNSDLTVEEVRGAPPAEEVFHEVQKVIDKNGNGCTAFNKSFDFGFLRDRGIIINDLPCIMELSTDVCKIPGKMGYKWPKVQEAFDFFFPGNNYEEHHRGLDDAKHEAMIAYELFKMGLFKIRA